MIKKIVSIELDSSDDFDRIKMKINDLYLRLIRITFNKNIIKNNSLSIEFFDILAINTCERNTYRTNQKKFILSTNTEIFFCKPKFIIKRFEKALKRFNNYSISFNELFNTLMFLQPYELNNIIILKYFTCVYKVITNGTFTFWNFGINTADYISVFTFNVNLNNLVTYYTNDIFLELEPHWPDIIIKPNLVCTNFILMCKCLNHYNINSNPIYIDNPNDYNYVTDDNSNDDSDNSDSDVTNNNTDNNTDPNTSNIYHNEYRLRSEIEFSNYYNFYSNKLLTF